MEKEDIVARLSTESFLSLPIEEQKQIVKTGRLCPELKSLKKLVQSKSEFTRNFNPELYETHEWLCGSSSKNKLFCWPCMLFRGEGKKTSWNSSGLNDLSNLHTGIKRHEAAFGHAKCCYQKLTFEGKTVDEYLDSVCNDPLEEVDHKQNRTENIIATNDPSQKVTKLEREVKLLREKIRILSEENSTLRTMNSQLENSRSQKQMKSDESSDELSEQIPRRKKRKLGGSSKRRSVQVKPKAAPQSIKRSNVKFLDDDSEEEEEKKIKVEPELMVEDV